MQINEAKLKEILLRENYITAEDITCAEEAMKTEHSTLIEYLLSENFITKDLLGQAIAESFGVSYAHLNATQTTPEQIRKIPESCAKKIRIVLCNETKDTVVVATDTPTQKGITQELKKLFPSKKITVTYELPEEIDAAFVHYQKPLETRFSKIIKEQERIAPEILDEIFNDALIFQASDIHFEPQKKEVVVRFRIDGLLHEAGRLPIEYYENVLNRIKVQSHLRIDEHFAAQDGSMRYTKNEKTFDLRISIIPTIEGEKVVFRVLSSYVQGFTMEHLGLCVTDKKMIQQIAKKPFGMIVVTGPTGSGKTTTLYALLKTLNRSEVNITTIEDPVEYKVLGVNQIQVNPQINLTFAKGLRSIVRQDPDIILVGEIRDQETAQIAINAALTGHLMLSTFHANDAATTIPRFLDMEVEPFLLASTLELIIAQRLVRKICEHCRYSITVTQKELTGKLATAKRFFTNKKNTFYQGKGCTACGHSGFYGRTAIFEFIRMTPEMQNLILKNPSTQEVRTLARMQGTRSLFEDGIEKVKNGITTLEELLRIAEPPK